MPRIISIDTSSLKSLVHASNFAAMAFSTSLLVLATVCCFVVNAAEEKLPLAVVAKRQSRQMFVMPPPPLFNYFNPYEAQMMVPFSSGGSEAEIEIRTARSEDLTLSPAATACVATATTSSNCIAASNAPTGTITATFTADKQTVVVSIGPSKFYYTRVKITCDTLTNVNGFTKSAQLTTAGVKEATETKPIVLIATSSGATGSLKCKWTSS